MNPRVTAVAPRNDFILEVIFSNQERKLFDVKPYLDKGIFKELRNRDVFNSVKVDNGSISWVGGQDLGPDTLYIDGLKIN